MSCLGPIDPDVIDLVYQACPDGCHHKFTFLSRLRPCPTRGPLARAVSLFIDMAPCRFFKTYFLDACLELTTDPVPNVRLHLAALLPALKQSIRQAPSSHTMRLHHDYKQFAVNSSNHCSECFCASCGEHNKTVDYTCIPVVDVDGTQTEPRLAYVFLTNTRLHQ